MKTYPDHVILLWMRSFLLHSCLLFGVLFVETRIGRGTSSGSGKSIGCLCSRTARGYRGQSKKKRPSGIAHLTGTLVGAALRVAAGSDPVVAGYSSTGYTVRRRPPPLPRRLGSGCAIVGPLAMNLCRPCLALLMPLLPSPQRAAALPRTVTAVSTSAITCHSLFQ